MDEVLYQQWTDTLNELRVSRQSLIASQVLEKGGGFGAKEFFNVAKESLESIVEAWFSLHQTHLEKSSSLSLGNGTQQAAQTELQSIIDFELEALGKDMEYARSQVAWDETVFLNQEGEFNTFKDELSKKYLLKLNTAYSGVKKKPESEAVPSPALSAAPKSSGYSSSGGSSGGSGVGVFTMFIVGLVIGIAPSLYFWDVARKAERKYKDERGKLISEKRELQDTLGMLQHGYYDLAAGKAKNLPQIEAEIRRIREDFNDRRQELDKEFTSRRETVLRKVSLDQLDKALDKLDAEKNERLESLKTREATTLEPFIKQQQTLKDLMGLGRE